MSFKSGVKGGGSDRWWDRRWWLWWGDMRMIRWTRRTVNRMRLTEWRRELIPQVRWCICEKRLVICECSVLYFILLSQNKHRGIPGMHGKHRERNFENRSSLVCSLWTVCCLLLPYISSISCCLSTR